MDPATRNSMELCRNVDDLSLEEFADLKAALETDPEFAAEFDRMCATDQLIRDQLQNVDVPAGLEGQVLANLGEAQSQNGEGEGPAEPHVELQNREGEAPAEPNVALLPKPVPGLSRRSVLWGVGSTVALALIALVAISLLKDDREFEVDVAAIQTVAKDDWLRTVEGLPPSTWRSADRLPTRAVWDLPSRQASLLVTLHNDSSSRTLTSTVFDLPSKTGYVVSVQLPKGVSVGNVPKGPPRTPFMTGGWAIGVWQEGNTLFVIMVKGSQEDYSNKLKRPELT